MTDLDPHSAPEPFDRLTRLAAMMTAAIESDENSDVRGIVFLNDSQGGGLQMFGYDDEAEGIADIFVHMKAIFQSIGKDLDFIAIPESPEGIDT